MNRVASDCIVYLAICYQQTGNFHKAAEWANKAIKDYPQLTPSAGSIQARKRYDYAAAAIEQAIKTNPTDLRLQEGVINSYAALGRWDDARSFVEALPATTTDECQRRTQSGRHVR